MPDDSADIAQLEHSVISPFLLLKPCGGQFLLMETPVYNSVELFMIRLLPASPAMSPASLCPSPYSTCPLEAPPGSLSLSTGPLHMQFSCLCWSGSLFPTPTHLLH